ncbi:Large cysteine-rich periplasmic protein omcB precursor [Planctomycetes bacterium K23_9]|uniref:Large cysteine-rich periplasmic protein omcB n=2 Tax=Stieleria marina TaxID=1930275 RepID=A0A517NMM3_9BACT|nr:Large cysteine-rich periplasmic protein omcB precursor [Planctomycetes bacterium K23_9]
MEQLELRRLLVAPTDLAEITGTLFDDTNGNGSLDGGEPGIVGATVELYRDSNGSGALEIGTDTQVLPNQTTNGAGQYTFDSLTADNYFVRQPAQTVGGRNLQTDVSPRITISANDVQGRLSTTIDSFDGTQQIANDSTNDGVPVAISQLAPEALGGERDLFVNKTSVNGAVQLSVNDPLLPNVLTFDSIQTGDGERRVVWDGVDGDAVTINDNGLSQDLTANGEAEGIRLEFGADLAGGNAVVRLYSDDANAATTNRFSTATIPIPVTGGGTTTTEYVPFSNFISAGGGGVNFADVGAIELDISGASNINGTADLVGTLAPNVFTANFDNLESSDLSLTKSVSDPTPNVGQQVVYTINVLNSGPSTATGVQVTDVLPAGVTLNSNSPSQGTFDPNSGIWTLGTLGATAGANTATLSLNATVNQLGQQTNTAQISASNQADPDSTPNNNNPGEDDQDSAAFTPESIDLSLTKTVSNPTPNIGDAITFTILVNNAGPSGATGINVRDVLPAGTSFVSATSNNGTTYNNGSGIWNLGSLGASQSAQLTITANVTASGSRTNIAEIISANEQDIDSTPGNNQIAEDDQDSAIFASSQADLSLTKTVSNATPNLGENVVFTVALQNSGTDAATNVTVADTLPAGLSFVSTDQPAAYNSATGVWTVGTITPGTTPSLQITARVDSLGVKTNTAQVRSSDINDPDSIPNNNNPAEDDQASVSVTPTSANLSLTKTVNNATPNLGDNVTFTITVNNAGPNIATGVNVRDQLPPGTTFVSSSSPTFNSATGIWNVGTVPVGGSQTLNLVATSNASGTNTNSAEIISSDQFDPNSTPGNNVLGEDDQDSAAITSQQIDLSLTKTVSNARPNVGEEVTFVITVNNAGPSTATGVAVTETLPAGVTLLGSTPSQGSFNSSTGVWTVGTIGVNGTQTLSLRARLDAITNDSNTAQITAADQNDVDSTPGNNVAAEDDQDSAAFVTPQADLSLTKSVNDPTPNVGDNITFTILLQNAGPDQATGVSVTDVLPTGVRFVSNSLTSGTYNSNTGIWNVGSVASGSNASLDIIGEVLALGATTNTAQVSAVDQADPDSSPGNNVANEDDQDSAQFSAQQIDLALTKTSSADRPAIGESFVYTLTTTNTGPDAATGVTVSDPLPDGVTFVSSSPAGAYNPASGLWTIGTIASGNSATLDIVVTAETPGIKTNTAQVASADQTDIDSTPGNSVAAEDDQAAVTTTPASADLSLTKTVDDANPNVGQQVTFNISVTNGGPDAASNIDVRDTLPSGMSLVNATPSTGNFNNGTGIWTIPILAANSSATLVIQASVDAVGDKVNTAEILTSSQFDPDSTPGNNDPSEDDQDSANLSPQLVDLALSKSIDNANPNIGDQIAYTLGLTNDGPSTATGVQVTDLLPTGLTFVSAVPTVGTYNASNGIWEIGTVTAGATPTLVINATVDNSRGSTNEAEITAADQPDGDSTPGNNLAGEDDQASADFVTQVADLSLTKTIDNTNPGRNDPVNFLLTLTNDGPNTATEVVVTDLIPAGLRFVSANPSIGTYNPTNGFWNVASLPVGAAATLQIATALTGATSTTNVAEITSARQFDIDSTPGNGVAGEDDISDASIDPQVVDIAVTGTVDNAEPLEGERIQLVFNATNAGPDAATNVNLRTLLPAGLTLISSQPQTGSYNSSTGEWTVGTLAAGASTTLTINAQVDSRGIRRVPIEVISTDQFDFDSTPANDVEAEDDQTEVLVRAPRLLQKRLFFSR